MDKLAEAEVNEQFKYPSLNERLLKLEHLDIVRFAVFCAEKVLHICESENNSKAPQLVIEAAKEYIKDPTEENKEKCEAAANVAYAAYAAANVADAADAANVANVAYAAAYAAANVAANAADAAAYAADAAYAAYAAAASDGLELKREILCYLVKLESGCVDYSVLGEKPVYTKAMSDTGGLPPVGFEFEYYFEFIEGSEFQYLAKDKHGWEEGDILEVVKITTDEEGNEVAIVLNMQANVLNSAIISNQDFFVKPKTEQEKLIDEASSIVDLECSNYNLSIACSAAMKAVIVCMIKNGYKKA